MFYCSILFPIVPENNRITARLRPCVILFPIGVLITPPTNDAGYSLCLYTTIWVKFNLFDLIKFTCFFPEQKNGKKHHPNHFISILDVVRLFGWFFTDSTMIFSIMKMYHHGTMYIYIYIYTCVYLYIVVYIYIYFVFFQNMYLVSSNSLKLSTIEVFCLTSLNSWTFFSNHQILKARDFLNENLRVPQKNPPNAILWNKTLKKTPAFFQGQL